MTPREEMEDAGEREESVRVKTSSPRKGRTEPGYRWRCWPLGPGHNRGGHRGFEYRYKRLRWNRDEAFPAGTVLFPLKCEAQSQVESGVGEQRQVLRNHFGRKIKLLIRAKCSYLR